MQDTGHILVDAHGFGAKAREELEAKMKSGELNFRDASDEMWASLHVPFDDGFVLMEKSIDMDSGFAEFHQYCKANGIPFNIISAGLKPVLRRVLDTFLGAEEVRSIRLFYKIVNYYTHRELLTNLIIISPPPLKSSPTTQISRKTARSGNQYGAMIPSKVTTRTSRSWKAVK